MLALTARRLLVVSPHLDDAALSVGATLAHRALRGGNSEVVTVFAKSNPVQISPVATQFHQECRLGSDAVAARKQEDAAAMSILGTTPHYLSFLDAIYRRDADGNWLCRHRRQMFQHPIKIEMSLVTEVGQALAGFADRVHPDLVMTCAGFGNHIDHAVTREATMRWAAREHIQMLLWEDLPYMFGKAIRAEEAGKPLTSAPPDLAWARKWRAIRAYPSQISMMWPNESDWQGKLMTHALARGSGRPAELLWTADLSCRGVAS